MKRNTMVFWLIIFLTIIAAMLLINRIKKIDDKVVEEYLESTTTETTNNITTTTTTTTTKKTTKKTKSFSKVATASRSEYINYARQVSGYDETQISCLIPLWDYESGWNPNDYNNLSGACGIPQSKPCNKIYKQQGSYDWQAQIRWGINYINSRYGSPCEALKFQRREGWY